MCNPQTLFSMSDALFCACHILNGLRALLNDFFS